MSSGETHRAVKLFIEQYGERALQEARARVEQMQSRGDNLGERIWREIVRQIEEAERRQPGTRIRLN